MMRDGARAAAVRFGGGLAADRASRLRIRRLRVRAGLFFLLRLLLLILIGAVAGG
jgi:hypothetical protein